MKKTEQRKNGNGSIVDRNKFFDKLFIQKVIYSLLFGSFVGGAGFSIPKFIQPGFTEHEKSALFATMDMIKLKQDAILLKFQRISQDLKHHKEGDHMTFEGMTEKFVQLNQYENDFLMLNSKINHIK